MTHRYPLEPLASAMGETVAAACRLLGVSGSVQQEYRRRGVTERVADRLAVRAGLHAYEVWPEMVDHHIAACSIECADERCSELFLPVNGNQRFCSERCQKRANGRRYVRRRYQSDPEFAEARREDSRRRRAEATEAWLRAERRRKNARYDPEARRRRYEREKARRAA